jgi:hypothetical protein
MAAQAALPTVAIACVCTACATLGGQALTPDQAMVRVSVLARSRVWRPTRIGTLDVKAGPPGPGAFRARSNVPCTYVDRNLGGQSPKFLCEVSQNDIVKVKFGAENGEVYGEVLATRLLWALGFGADRVYPVTVTCRGCPPALGGVEAAGDARRFDPAAVERLMDGREWPADGAQGWAWNDLDVVNPKAGGATLAERDALKLLAVFLQHSDSKPDQQRILCLGERDGSASGNCRRPFLMISDVGLTFGRASRTNANAASSVNLAAWRDTPIWKDETGCKGNLPRSLTGTLDDPTISEEGRQFLAGLLAQLSDRQLGDLFEIARVDLRLRSPGDPSSGHATVGEWVEAFKDKRAQVAARRCASGLSTKRGES